MELAADTSASFAPLVTHGDSLYTAIGSRIRAAGATGGYLVITRRINSNPQALDLLRGLVGPDARILLGVVHRGSVGRISRAA